MSERTPKPEAPSGTCASCQWWKPFSPLRHLGDCLLFETSNGDKVEPEAKLFVTRTKSGEATVVTYPDFGCVQWGGGGMTCTQLVPNASPATRKLLSHKGSGEYHTSTSSISCTRSAATGCARKPRPCSSFRAPFPQHQAVPARTRHRCAKSMSVRICPHRTLHNQPGLYPIGYKEVTR